LVNNWAGYSVSLCLKEVPCPQDLWHHIIDTNKLSLSRALCVQFLLCWCSICCSLTVSSITSCSLEIVLYPWVLFRSRIFRMVWLLCIGPCLRPIVWMCTTALKYLFLWNICILGACWVFLGWAEVGIFFDGSFC
jgi:hypothetical protein